MSVKLKPSAVLQGGRQLTCRKNDPLRAVSLLLPEVSLTISDRVAVDASPVVLSVKKLPLLEATLPAPPPYSDKSKPGEQASGAGLQVPKPTG